MGTTASVIGAGSSALNQAGSLLGISTLGQSNNPQDDVTLVIGRQQISGWERVRITRGIERLPSDFDIELTEKYPGDVSNVVIQAGMTCVLKIGSDTVVTGYVDKYIPAIDSDTHIIRVTGRGKCQDLVDCSAEWPTGQISSTNALDIATKLAAPYGIKVIPPLASFTLIAIPQFNLNYSESPASIIETVTRFSGLLYYEDVNGNLVLSEISRTAAGSGFQQGVNVQRAIATFTMDQRFRFLEVRIQSMSVNQDSGMGGDITWPQPPTTVADGGVIRHRKKSIICEFGGVPSQVQGLDVMGLRRFHWEVARRFGRSYKVEITTDSWRDVTGKLWTPNTLVPIDIPAVKLPGVQYVISEVTFERSLETGTTARIIAMPAEAFSLEPLLINPPGIPEAGAPLPVPGLQNASQSVSVAPQPAVTATSPTSGVNTSTLGQDIINVLDSPDIGDGK